MADRFDTIHVYDIDTAPLDPLNRKAVLAMQATGLFVDGDDRFEESNGLLHAAAQEVDRPPTMTYEDLVFINPVFGQVRVMAADPVAAGDEANFYQAHRIIEGHLYGAIEKLVYLDANPDGHTEGREAFGPGAREAGFAGTEYTPVEELAFAVQGLIALHTSLDAKTFSAFRPYFAGLNGYPGASGLYSESIPIIDLLVHGGSNLQSAERDQIAANLNDGLYPDQNNHAALLESLLAEEHPQMYLPEDTRLGMVRQLNGFRRLHRGSVKKLLPEVFSGKEEGSAGTVNVPGYLESKVIAIQRGSQQ